MDGGMHHRGDIRRWCFLYMRQEKRTKKKKWLTRILTIVLALILVPSAILLGVFSWMARGMDGEEDRLIMDSMRASRTTTFYVSDTARGTMTGLDNYVPQEWDIVYGEDNLVWVDSQDIPDCLKQAFVAIEDRRFFEHKGIDWYRTALAALNYLFRFRESFGGSTITQQLVKNVHGDNAYSPQRKIKEIIRASRVEKMYSKDEILTYYLNIVPLGNACVGVRSASRFYFNKEPADLTLGECAAIAVITNAPSRFEPIAHPAENEARRKLVLDAMAKAGYISQERAELEKSTEVILRVTDPIFTSAREHNWYIETVISDVAADLSKRLDISLQVATSMIYRGGLKIYTLMDPVVQTCMEESLGNTATYLTENGQIQGCMVIKDSVSGDILGIVGGTGEKRGTRILNRATDGYYPPGSSIKPLSIYAPALERGLVHWGTAFLDAPGMKNGEPWPRNSPALYAGQIPCHDAIAQSKNTIPVQLLHALGKKEVYRLLKDEMGFRKLTNQSGTHTDLTDAPLALGQFTYGTSVREMADAFSAFADRGEYHKGRTYLAVYDSGGNLLLEKQEESHPLWTQETAYILTKMMEEVVDTGTARSVTLKEMVDTAGKTGTSAGERDKWFVGYTPYYLCAVHFGMDDASPLPAGCRLHLTVWDEVMRALHREISERDGYCKGFSMPRGIVCADYCRDSGMQPCPHCREELRGNRVESGYFTMDNMPSGVCTMHREAYYDVLEGLWTEDETESFFSFPFSVFDPPPRLVPEGVFLQDTPYTLDSLMEAGEEPNGSEEQEPEA